MSRSFSLLVVVWALLLIPGFSRLVSASEFKLYGQAGVHQFFAGPGWVYYYDLGSVVPIPLRENGEFDYRGPGAGGILRLEVSGKVDADKITVTRHFELPIHGDGSPTTGDFTGEWKSIRWYLRNNQAWNCRASRFSSWIVDGALVETRTTFAEGPTREVASEKALSICSPELNRCVLQECWAPEPL